MRANSAQCSLFHVWNNPNGVFFRPGFARPRRSLRSRHPALSYGRVLTSMELIDSFLLAHPIWAWTALFFFTLFVGALGAWIAKNDEAIPTLPDHVTNYPYGS